MSQVDPEAPETDLSAVVPVSVVIPVRNEADNIDALLDALMAQTPLPQRIIVVDAGSTDGTRDRLRERAGTLPCLQVIEVPRAYPGEGRNIGTAAADTEWIVYTDGGNMPHAGWLQALWTAVADTDLDAAYGLHVAELTTRRSRWFVLAFMTRARGLGTGLMRHHYIACSIVRKAAWQRIGGFPPTRAAEDRMFMIELDKGPVTDVPAAVVTWSGPRTWAQIWSRSAILAEHGARAGRTRDWHWPTVRLWAGGALLAWLLPTPANLAVLSAAMLARGERRRRRHSDEPALRDARWGDLLGVSACLVVLDLAMYWGWFRRYWYYRDPGGAPPTASAPA